MAECRAGVRQSIEIAMERIRAPGRARVRLTAMAAAHGIDGIYAVPITKPPGADSFCLSGYSPRISILLLCYIAPCLQAWIQQGAWDHAF